MYKRVCDLAMLVGKKRKVYLNDSLININNLTSYSEIYKKDNQIYKENNDQIYKENKQNIIIETCKTEESKNRWHIAVSKSNNGYKNISFVNGINTYNGGKHVDYIVSKISKSLKERILSKYKSLSKDIEIKDQQIKDRLFIIIVCTIENPSFSSQSKEELNTPIDKFGSKCEFSDNFIKKVYDILDIDELVETQKIISDALLTKLLSKKGSIKSHKIRDIPKLNDAYFAGSKKSKYCTLLLTEGDSAKAMAISGISAINISNNNFDNDNDNKTKSNSKNKNLNRNSDKKNRANDFYGVFPLRGKLLNVRAAKKRQIINNEEFINLQKIIGLDIGKIYDNNNINDLRYGQIILMMDADVDGSHIKGLFINMIDYFWPSLLKINGFIKIFNTPVIKTSYKDKILEFFTLAQYTKWKTKHTDYNKYNIKYYKGLGTNTNEEAKNYFKNLDKYVANLEWDDQSSNSIKLAFDKKLTDDRKRWLQNYDKNSVLDYSKGNIKYSDFINKELIHFSYYDNDRSIPSLVDGLKPSQRKVLYCAFKKKLKTPIKVAQFVGYISEHASYHHGEISLAKAIIGMAQNFVGSNNINLLKPEGQFGTRLMGGKDSASPRYIHTMLEEITSLIYHPDDNNILDYLDDDGFPIEPSYYVPIIPMILVNGAEGIGTGYNTKIPSFNPIEIIDIILNKLDNTKVIKEIFPWYKDYYGKIEKISDIQFKTTGLFKINEKILIIKELPIGTWTENYKMFLQEKIQNDKLKGIISNIRNNSDEANIEFIIKYKNVIADNVDEIKKLYQLEEYINIGNMYLHDVHGNLKKYDTPMDIINEFYSIRLNYYDKRKIYILAELQKEIKNLEIKLNFINIVINNKNIFKMSSDAIKKLLQKEKLDIVVSEDDNQHKIQNKKNNDDNDNNNNNDKIYDYLIKLPFGTFTKEKVVDLQNQIQNKKKLYDEISKITIENMWKTDLMKIKKYLLSIN